jgi:transposase
VVEERVARSKKKAEAEGATLIYLDEACFQLMPTRRRTLAPRGETPKLPAWDRHGKISTIGAITISPIAKREGFLFHMLPADQNFNAALVIEFLRDVCTHIPGPIKLIWDRANIHRAKVTQEFLANQPRVEATYFPPYAPETNPVEGCWGHAKYHQMPNLIVKNVDELRDRAECSLNDIKFDRSLLKAFIKHAHNPSAKKGRLPLCRTQ